MNVEENDNIYHLKNEIKNKEGIEENLQRLFYSGKLLDDDLLLKDYGIVNESTIFFSLQMRGGSKKKKEKKGKKSKKEKKEKKEKKHQKEENKKSKEKKEKKEENSKENTKKEKAKESKDILQKEVVPTRYDLRLETNIKKLKIQIGLPK